MDEVNERVNMLFRIDDGSDDCGGSAFRIFYIIY